MKNGSIYEQLTIHEQQFIDEKKNEIFQSSEIKNNISCNIDSKQNSEQFFNQVNSKTADSLLSIFSLRDTNNYDATQAEKLQAKKLKKIKKKGIR